MQQMRQTHKGRLGLLRGLDQEQVDLLRLREYLQQLRRLLRSAQ